MKLYAIRYAKEFIYGTKGTVFRDAENGTDKVENFSFFYYLMELGGRTHLVDTGFRDGSLAAEMGVTLLSVEEELEQVFGRDLSIDTIMITHSHWDHINNLDLYKPQKIIMAEEAYRMAMEEGTEDVKRSLSIAELTLIKKELLVADRFLFRVIGGHTPDSSVIFFEEMGKKYVITGDECYLQDNIYKNIPIGICVDPKKNEEFIHFCHERDYIPLPFHDGGILEKYEKMSEHIVRIF